MPGVPEINLLPIADGYVTQPAELDDAGYLEGSIPGRQYLPYSAPGRKNFRRPP